MWCPETAAAILQPWDKPKDKNQHTAVNRAEKQKNDPISLTINQPSNTPISCLLYKINFPYLNNLSWSFLLLETKSSLIEKNSQKKFLVHRFSELDLVPLRKIFLCLDKLTCTLFPRTWIEFELMEEDNELDTYLAHTQSLTWGF